MRLLTPLCLAILSARPCFGAPFDQHKIVFSPKGDLLQLSYAAEAVSRSSPIAALKTRDGVCVVALKTVSTAEAKLRDFETLEKLSLADNHVAVGACGLKPDSLLVRSLALDLCAEHRRQFDEPIPLLLLANKIADLLHEFTQGLNRGRPLGTGVLIAGWDLHGGVQIYQVASTGAVTSWKAACLGLGSAQVEKDLEAELDSSSDSAGESSLTLEAARSKLLQSLDTAVQAKGYQRLRLGAEPDAHDRDVSYTAEVITLIPPTEDDLEDDDLVDETELLILSPGQRKGERVDVSIEVNAK